MGQPGRGSRPGWRELAAASCPRAVSCCAAPSSRPPGVAFSCAPPTPGSSRCPAQPAPGRRRHRPGPLAWHLLTLAPAPPLATEMVPGERAGGPAGPRTGDLERRRLFGVGVLSETPGGLARGRAGLEREPALSASPDATCHFVGWCKVEPTTG